MLIPHVLLRHRPPFLHRLPRRLQQRKRRGPASLRRPPRLRRLLQRLLPEKCPHAQQPRQAAGQYQLLLRQRRHEPHLPDRQLRLLPAHGLPLALGQPPDLRLLPLAHHGHLRRRRLQQEPAAQPRLCRLGQHGQ